MGWMRKMWSQSIDSEKQRRHNRNMGSTERPAGDTKMTTNELTITSATDITLRTPKGTLAGFRWDGAKLVHRNGKTTMAFTAAKSAEIVAAISSTTATVVERKTGAQIASGTDKDGWRWVAGTDGVYERVTAGKAATVEFAKADMI